MKFGLCTDLDRFLALKRAYPDCPVDYLELNAQVIAKMEEAEYAAFCERVAREGAPLYSVNGLVPAEIRLDADGFDSELVKTYAIHCFSRLARLGITMLVFGSSAAKKLPAGYPRDKAWQELDTVGHIFGETAARYGQTIAVEPLRYAEVNIVNTLDEGAYYVNRVGLPSFRLLADFYHVGQNREPLSNIEKYRDMLCHFHIASPSRSLLTEEHRDFVSERVGLLKKIGFTGGVSFEGASGDDLAAVCEMFRILRETDDAEI